jgi:hypothetical protein
MLGQQGVGATIDDRALLLENAQQDFLHDVIVIDHQYAHSLQATSVWLGMFEDLRRPSTLPIVDCNGISNQKVLPTSTVLSAPIVPPIKCTKERGMDRPGPVPPNRPVVAASA